jgi:DNA-binding CsgD family transcriptional regulator
MLRGRRDEHETLRQMLVRARDGHSGVLVLRGEAGIGKTALLQDLGAGAGHGFRTENVVGMESEAEFAFAGLHQLCAPLLARSRALPEPQQAALGVAFGLRDGAAPDRFLVGLAILNLLAEVAEDGPLLCVVDDAQWLDQASAQVLAFVARRVVAERVVLLFALRDAGQGDPGDVDAFTGLPELRLHGLADTEARTLLATGVATSLDDEVRDRIIAEARGNPLALLELPRGVERAQLVGGFELPDVVSVPRRIEDVYRWRSNSLPAATRLLLLVAAAEPTGEAALLWRAAAHLDLTAEAAAPAEAAGLVEIDTRVRFRHPLVRSAVYQAATPPDRRRAHHALAAATDPQRHPDRRAWHRAQAVLGTDEDAAAELERSAGRARARGGLAAAAAFLHRAAELTPEPARRAARTLDAAHTTHEAGGSAAAAQLLEVAAQGPLDGVAGARLQLLRARIAFHLTRGGDVPGMLLDAATRLAPLDPALSRETYLHALDAAMIVSGPGDGRDVRKVAEAATAAPAPPGPPGPADLLLDGLVTTFTRGYAAGVPGLRRAVEAFRSEGSTGDADGRRWLWLASRTAGGLLDAELAHLLAERNVRVTREAGAVAALPGALVFLSATQVTQGNFGYAAELAAESEAITQATGAAPRRYAQLLLAAWRGRRTETVELHAAMVREAARPTGTEVALAYYALSVLHNGHGDYPVALAVAERACNAHELTHSSTALPELIEAATRAGEPERAADALEQLCSRAQASGTPFALGLAARSRALTSTGPAAEENYREAVDRLKNSRAATHLARAHLVYGEWLRREGRRHDAREQLRAAHEMLSGMGAEAFAARAARELRATGEHPRGRTAQPADALTAQELQIARLVATGSTSREVGTQLFLSPRTIEAHLRSVFRKLGITSRRQLRDLQLA